LLNQFGDIKFNGVRPEVQFVRAPRFCAAGNAITEGFVAEGNPFAIEFNRSTEKRQGAVG